MIVDGNFLVWLLLSATTTYLHSAHVEIISHFNSNNNIKLEIENISSQVVARSDDWTETPNQKDEVLLQTVH